MTNPSIPSMNTRIAYLDCFAGISGDMMLGALIGAGVPVQVMHDAIAALNVGVTLQTEIVDRSGISSIKVHVLEGDVLAEAVPAAHSHTHAHEEPHTHTHSHDDSHGHSHTHDHAHDAAHSHEHEHEPHTHDHAHNHADGRDRPHVHGRSLTVIREMFRSAPLSAGTRHIAMHAFELLGHSEAKIHNVPVDKIHFHEVGALDAIADIVAASAGIAWLDEVGPVQWFCSPVNVGSGTVECAHGTFPVPAPATADLLRDCPTYAAHVQKELVTPTGAALLRAIAPKFAEQPAMRVQSIGYGAGTRNPKGFPNVLRLSIGEAVAAQEAHSALNAQTVSVLETAVDDLNPQVLAYVTERLLQLGALDVMLTPVIMKKGRSGTLLTALADPSQAASLEHCLLSETSTLGVRRREEQRVCLDRVHMAVTTAYGEIRVKVGSLAGKTLNAAPEFEDCRAAAVAHDVPVKRVIEAAMAAYARLTP